MIRRFSKCLFFSTNNKQIKWNQLRTAFKPKFRTSLLFTQSKYNFSQLPKHKVLQMPALSPTMSQGKVVKWNKKIGDAIEEGDIICQVETDKATVGFEATQKGFLAQKKDTDKPVPVGSPLIVLVKKNQQVKNFQNFKFQTGSSKKSQSQQNIPKTQSKKKQVSNQQSKTQKVQQKSQPKTQNQKQNSYPKHSELKMPALSPTMTQGKIKKWNVKQGQQYSQGDSLCDIQTDKATVAFQATQKGVLAKILAKQDTQMKVGDVLGVSVKNKSDAAKFADFKGEKSKPKQAAPKQEKQPKEKSDIQNPKKQQENQKQENKSSKQVTRQMASMGMKQKNNQKHVFASPLAKKIANEKGIDLGDVEKGSGPQGRIIKQDIQQFKLKQKTTEASQTKRDQKSETNIKAPSKQKPQKIQIPQNPFQQIPLTNMRKTIAARLTQSKTTIPHYYINCSVEMDKINALRTQLNANEKDNGVKISVNDIIVKAIALALRDYPNVNSQWHQNSVRRFKHADVSVAVATEGGLITPIVYRADTLGLLDIARRTKDIAARARTGKLDPRQYIGGTTTVSNVGMFGVDSVISVINPPQSTIVGVGKTQKKLLHDPASINQDRPFRQSSTYYRVAQVMELVVSADHRVVDGAVASQWLMRIKKYLEHPTHMLL